MSGNVSQVKAIIFDVFGTIVDWRSSIIREITTVGEKLGVTANWESFVDTWRAGYHKGTKDVVDQKREWITADAVHLERLHLLIDDLELNGLSEEEIIHPNKMWHRFTPWSDSIERFTHTP